MRYNHFDMLPEQAFQRDASGKIKPQGGGGSSSPSKSTVTQTNIPEYARPYAESMLGRAQALTDVNQNPYQPYTDQRFAGFSPMQAQAFQQLSGQQVAPQLTDASNIAYSAAGQALRAQPQAQMLQNTALGYGQAGAGYGGAASQLGMAGAQQAQMASQQAQRQAGLYGLAGYQAGQAGMDYGGMGAGFGQQAAGYGALGAEQAAMISGGALGRAQQLGGMATGIGGYGQMLAQQTAQQAGAGAMGYGAQGAGYGAQGVSIAEQAQRAAERQADIYGQMGAGYGAQGADIARQSQLQAQQQAMGYGQMGARFGAAAAGLAPQAQQFGGTAAQMGAQGMGYGQAGAGIGGLGVQAAQQGFGAQQAYQQMATSPEAQQAYMSPYMQNVVAEQQKDARRQAEIERQAVQAQAVKSGAFGGSRSAIVEAENQKNLQDRLAQIQATGSQQAFQQAQQAQQFGAGLGIQGLQAGYQGLQTGLAGTAQGMQGAQTGIAGQQAGLAGLGQAGQLYGLGMQGAQAGLQGTGQFLSAGQLGLQGAQAGMQGAGLGLQGTGQRLAAGQLGLAGTAQGMQGAGLGLQGIGQLLASGQLGVQGSQLGLQGVTAGMQGVGQELQAGQLGLAGTAQGIQGAQAGIQGAQAGMQGAGLGIQGAQAGLQGVGQQIAGGQLGLQGVQAGIAGQQAGIQGAQAGMQGVGQAVGAGQYGLQGAQTAISGAGQLGQLGQTQYAQEMGITDAMQKYGALQQQQQQQQLDFAYQQYLAQQQYPYQQLSYMSDLLRGVPSTQSAQYMYQQQPAMAPQLLGAGLSAYGALARAKGGRIPEPQRYAAGGQVTPDAMSTMAVQELPSRLRRLSDTQLAAYARTVKDAITLSAVQGELNRRTRARAPMGQPQDTTVADDIAKQAQAASLGGPITMAGGGIVALQGGAYLQDVMGGYQPTAEELLQYQPGPTFGEAVSNRIQAAQEARAAEDAALRSQFLQQNAPHLQQPQATPELVDESAMGVPAQTRPPVGIAVAGQNVPPPPPAAPRTAPQTAPTAAGPGIMGARSIIPGSFEEYRQQIGQAVQRSPEDQKLLDDMANRVKTRMERAGKQEDTAKYDAIMMAGLAMMGGTSLADGIARAAQTGGATYMQGKDKAAKAMEAAEEADISFQKYKIALDRNDKKEAADMFKDYSAQVLKLQEIQSKYAEIGARSKEAAAARQTALEQKNEAGLRNSYAVISNNIARVEGHFDTQLANRTKTLSESLFTADPKRKAEIEAQIRALPGEIEAEKRKRLAPMFEQQKSLAKQLGLPEPVGDLGGFTLKSVK